MKTGTELIAEERQKQIDDNKEIEKYDFFDLIDAAISYLVCQHEEYDISSFWPFAITDFKPINRKLSLIQSGTLIAAALDQINQEAIDSIKKAEELEQLNKNNEQE